MALRDPASSRTLLPLTGGLRGVLVAAATLPLALMAVPAGSAAMPSIAVSDAEAIEGDTGIARAVFVVRVRGRIDGPLTVGFSTQPGTAGDGDFVARQGRLRFGPGTRVRQVAVDVMGDVEVEPDEWFLLLLRKPRGGRLATRAGTATIADDDRPTAEPPSAVVPPPPPPPPPADPVGRLVLNEVDYDQPGTDTAEFVEVRNASGDTVSLAGLVLHLVNGGDGATYGTVDLSGPGVLAPGGYLVVASTTVTPASGSVVVPFAAASGNIQNGPDGLALAAGCTVVDALSYEGAIASAVLEGCAGTYDLGPAPAAADSNSVDGSLSRQAGGAWAFVGIATPGSANAAAE